MRALEVRLRRVILTGWLLAAAAIAAACGSGSDSGPDGAPPPLASAVSGAPTADATEAALVTQLQDLAGSVLAAQHLPPGFTVRSSQPATRGQVAAAQIGIPKLAEYVGRSDLEGAWATLYTRDEPSSGISSVAYRFGAPESARGFVEATASLQAADYPAATSVERVQAESIGDAAQMMRYRLPGARTLEYTWAQGNLVGQVILRNTGDVERPDDIGLVISLARQQAQKMWAPPTP